MPRYFFDIESSDDLSRDGEGLDLPSLDRATAEAIATLPALARERPPGEAHWSIRSRVRNEIGDVVFEATLTFEAKHTSRADTGG